MFLKRLTCQGFKSFADKTDFDFMPGVTGIVGPNGCGKSNVVDAIKWVLGEQSARSLRGRQMMDVIFNGSGTRRSSGVAQVDLVFDNADQTLPCDQTEVTVSRRLYRSGESEYLLNSQACRLKDVRELFLDTGVGVDAYSIIEQGKVDVLLQANPAERRIIFEEAAGISRYKARKKEAIRKLDRVEQNLLRLTDIIEEVEKRLRSVKYQAGKARNYQTYAARLRELRASFSLSEYHRLTQRHAALSAQIDSATDRAAELRTRIGQAETAQSQHDAAILQLDDEIHDVEQRLLTVTAEITAHQERISQSRQRLDEQRETQARAQSRLFAEQQRAASLGKRIGAEERAVEDAEAQVRAQQERVDALHAEDQALSKEFTTLQAQLEDDKAGIIDLLRRTAQLHNDISSLEVHRENLAEQKGRLAARDNAIRQELTELLNQKAKLEARKHEITSLLAAETQRLEEKRQQAHQLDSTRAALETELAEAKEHRSALLSRKQLLCDLDRRFEGIESGVRSILERKSDDATGATFGYVRGIVAELLSADVSHAMIIESVLGDADQHLVVTDSALFLADQDKFDDLPGRVHAICLDRLGPVVNERDFSEQPGFIANAADLVSCPDDLKQLARHLLGKTVVVRSLDDAMRMADLVPSQHRFVTLAGQVVEPGGRISVGPAGSHGGLISRKSELREIDQHISDVERQVAILTDRRTRMSAEAEHLDHVQQELRTAIYEARTAEVETNAALNTNGEGIRRLTQEQPLIAGEVESIERQIAQAVERSSASHSSLKELEQQNAAREAHVQRLHDRIDLLASQRSALAERLTEARVQAGQFAEKRAGLAENLRAIRDAQRGASEAVAQAQQEAADCRHRLEQLERNILGAGSRLAELYATKEERSRDALGRRRERERLRHEIETLSAQARQCRSELEEVESKLHTVQMEHQEARVRRDELVTRIRGELEIDLPQQYASYEHTEQDWSEVEQEIADLRQKIERLGNVNLDAITEQDELEERAKFLNEQHGDLAQSKRQLEELIERLNDESRKRFEETFHQVRTHFQELYRKLFGGGKADILLETTDGEGTPDILEAGIEIQARPPGKELQSISLLSGGEKTMTAIALLLAIFKSRPSPFAILDEVDAALDEANNERFNRIVREFLTESQFILITHSKRTMSIADVLYGVTMQEAGVSKRVAVRFDDESPESKPAVA
ncbi:MAG: chromosome segregation protein SMC [Phycisphaerae bacterium]|nr:chromosome segregation protein SMC [Phycisphaerae bacterium]